MDETEIGLLQRDGADGVWGLVLRVYSSGLRLSWICWMYVLYVVVVRLDGWRDGEGEGFWGRIYIVL